MMRAIEWIEHWKGSNMTRTLSQPGSARRASAHQPDQELVLRELLAEAHARIRALESAIDRLKTSM